MQTIGAAVLFLQSGNCSRSSFVPGNSRVDIRRDQRPLSWRSDTFPVAHVLGLDRELFARGAEYCATFSKAVRKGSTLELSGSEAFNGVVLPLVSALIYDADHQRVQRQELYWPTIVLAVCVLQAPM